MVEEIKTISKRINAIHTAWGIFFGCLMSGAFFVFSLGSKYSSILMRVDKELAVISRLNIEASKSQEFRVVMIEGFLDNMYENINVYRQDVRISDYHRLMNMIESDLLITSQKTRAIYISGRMKEILNERAAIEAKKSASASQQIQESLKR